MFSLEGFDKAVNESSDFSKAESRYNFSLDINGQYSGNITRTILYGEPVSTAPGVDAAYIPTSTDLHFGDSSWGGEPFGYFTYDELISKDFLGNERTVNIPSVFYYNFDELSIGSTGYRGLKFDDPDQDIFRRDTSNDLQESFFKINNGNLPVDIGAIEMQQGE